MRVSNKFARAQKWKRAQPNWRMNLEHEISDQIYVDTIHGTRKELEKDVHKLPSIGGHYMENKLSSRYRTHDICTSGLVIYSVYFYDSP